MKCLTHDTSVENALSIIKDGEIRPGKPRLGYLPKTTRAVTWLMTNGFTCSEFGCIRFEIPPDAFLANREFYWV